MGSVKTNWLMKKLKNRAWRRDETNGLTNLAIGAAMFAVFM